MATLQVDLGEPRTSQVEPEESPDVIARRDEQLDMAKLRMMSVERRREVASMDMVGEYGSKVSAGMGRS